MPSIDDTTYERLQALCAEGDALCEQEDFEAALLRFQAAFKLIPEPRSEYEASTWVLAAMADACFFLGRFEDVRVATTQALLHGQNATGNPFLHLRLGQAHLELGDEARAADSLAGALMLAGPDIFEGQDPKYWDFIRTRVEPPPGGW